MTLMADIHPSIHPSIVYTACSLKGRKAIGGVHPGQFTSVSQGPDGWQVYLKSVPWAVNGCFHSNLLFQTVLLCCKTNRRGKRTKKRKRVVIPEIRGACVLFCVNFHRHFLEAKPQLTKADRKQTHRQDWVLRTVNLRNTMYHPVQYMDLFRFCLPPSSCSNNTEFDKGVTWRKTVF